MLQGSWFRARVQWLPQRAQLGENLQVEHNMLNTGPLAPPPAAAPTASEGEPHRSVETVDAADAVESAQLCAAGERLCSMTDAWLDHVRRKGREVPSPPYAAQPTLA